MDQRVLISVIVPVYNVEQYLPRCVDSILAQTYRNLEVILVDDGTKDASDKICDEYAAKDPRVRVIHKENGGLSSARNAGIDIARGEYLGFVDSDDWIEPEMYETMLGLAERYSVKLVCAGRYDTDGGLERRVGLCPTREEVISGMELLGRVFVWDNVDSAAWDKLYHRSLFETIRYPQGMINEDVAIFYKLAEQVEQAAMCDKPFYHYFHRPGSITTAKVSEKTFHFSWHTAVIYPYIRENHPEIAPQARYFRVRSLVHDLLSISLAGEEARREFAGQYEASREALKEHTGFIRKSPYFGRKERLTDLLLIWGLYDKFRSVYHRIKRSEA